MWYSRVETNNAYSNIHLCNKVKLSGLKQARDPLTLHTSDSGYDWTKEPITNIEIWTCPASKYCQYDPSTW